MYYSSPGWSPRRDQTGPVLRLNLVGISGEILEIGDGRWEMGDGG